MVLKDDLKAEGKKGPSLQSNPGCTGEGSRWIPEPVAGVEGEHRAVSLTVSGLLRG